MEFWKHLIDKNFELKNVLKNLHEVSGQISQVYSIFRQIDQISNLKDYKVYYFFGMIQKFLLNDEQGYEHYINKTQSIKNM